MLAADGAGAAAGPDALAGGGLVERLEQRVEQLEETVADLSLELRLARRSAAGSAFHLPLPLSQAASSAGGSAVGSPRIAGPVSTAGTPRSARLLSLPGGHGSSQQAGGLPAGASSCPGSASANCSGGGSGAGTSHGPGPSQQQQQHHQQPELGFGFAFVKASFQEAAAPSHEALSQAVERAAQIAADATDAAARCQQQLLELRGRHCQAERRLDTLWQLQETASGNAASVARLQEELATTRQAAQATQQNLQALRAQLQQLDARCDDSGRLCGGLQDSLAALQAGVARCSGDARAAAALQAEQHGSLEQSLAMLRGDLAAGMQQLQGSLDAQQQRLGSCAAAAAVALGKAEDLRQGAVVASARLEGVAAQIEAAIAPLRSRLDGMEAAAAVWAQSAHLAAGAVQHEQLAAALACASTSCGSRAQQLASQQAGIAARVEALERSAADRGQLVVQGELRHRLAQLDAAHAAQLQAAVAQLTSQLAEQSRAASQACSTLADRLTTSESGLLLRLSALRDQQAAAAQAGALNAWQQRISGELAGLTQAVAALQAGLPPWGAAGALGSVSECVAVVQAALAAPQPGTRDKQAATARRSTSSSRAQREQPDQVSGAAHNQLQPQLGQTAAGGRSSSSSDSVRRQPQQPRSSLQPWAVQRSPPPTPAPELRSAAINAKLARAAAERETAQQQAQQQAAWLLRRGRLPGRGDGVCAAARSAAAGAADGAITPAGAAVVAPGEAAADAAPLPAHAGSPLSSRAVSLSARRQLGAAPTPSAAS